MTRHSSRERDYTFGQVMLTLRSSIGLTQAGLADLLGVSRRAVGEWEGGLNYPKAEHFKHFIALCRADQPRETPRDRGPGSVRGHARWPLKARSSRGQGDVGVMESPLISELQSKSQSLQAFAFRQPHQYIACFQDRRNFNIEGSHLESCARKYIAHRPHFLIPDSL
jgi:transcriptional regulator with XRE-family HTH domain